MCQIQDLEQVLPFISNASTVNSQNSPLTSRAVMCAAPGFAFDILGSGEINIATDLSSLLGGGKKMRVGGRPTTKGVK